VLLVRFDFIGQLQVARQCELGREGGWVRCPGLAGRAVKEGVQVLPEGALLLARHGAYAGSRGTLACSELRF
jgi:hypothetical protein